jgi:hypothetical protein
MDTQGGFGLGFEDFGGIIGGKAVRVKDYWHPSPEEVQGLIESCSPVDDKFGDRLFDIVLEGKQTDRACLNLLYEVKESLGITPPSLEDMIMGFEDGVFCCED